MTAYFDEKSLELRALREAGRSPMEDEVRSWVNQLVQDKTLVCEYDVGGSMEFPRNLRDAVYKLILKSSGEHWPTGVKGWGVDYEFDEQGMTLLSGMVSDLHSLFHSAAHAGWLGSDSPRAPLAHMAQRREDRCEELIVLDPSLVLTP